MVRWTESGAAEVELFAQLDRLDVLRLFDFGLAGILPPEAVARPEPRPGSHVRRPATGAHAGSDHELVQLIESIV